MQGFTKPSRSSVAGARIVIGIFALAGKVFKPFQADIAIKRFPQSTNRQMDVQHWNNSPFAVFPSNNLAGNKMPPDVTRYQGFRKSILIRKPKRESRNNAN
jgi:hypothetical protein